MPHIGENCFLSTGRVDNIFPTNLGSFQAPQTCDISLSECFYLLFALKGLMKQVTKATSGCCFFFPKQWEGHKCHFYLCSYQHWTGGHRLPFLVPATTASLRNLGPPCTIVLSYRKCGSLLTPSIHLVSCVRLPCPVFIFFAFCLHPPYRIFLTSTKP